MILVVRGTAIFQRPVFLGNAMAVDEFVDRFYDCMSGFNSTFECELFQRWRAVPIAIRHEGEMEENHLFERWQWGGCYSVDLLCFVFHVYHYRLVNKRTQVDVCEHK